MQLQTMKAGSPSSIPPDLWSSGIWFWVTVENTALSLYHRTDQETQEPLDWKFMVSRCFTCISSCVEWRSCSAIQTIQCSATLRTTLFFSCVFVCALFFGLKWWNTVRERWCNITKAFLCSDQVLITIWWKLWDWGCLVNKCFTCCWHINSGKAIIDHIRCPNETHLNTKTSQANNTSTPAE